MTDCDKEDQIDKKSLEISQADDEVYTKMTDLADELPDNSPRFVLLSYPLTLVSRALLRLTLNRVLIVKPGFRAPVSSIRNAKLSPANLLERDAHALRRSQGVSTESERNWTHY